MIPNKRIKSFTRTLMISTCFLLLMFGISVYLFTSRLQMIHFNEIGCNYTQFVSNILRELTKADLEHGYVYAQNDSVIKYANNPESIVNEFHARKYLEQINLTIDELESIALISFKSSDTYIVNDSEEHKLWVGQRYYDTHPYYISAFDSEGYYFIQVPVHEQYVTQGVISLKFALSGFEQQFIKESKYQETGAFLIVDSNGHVVVKSGIFNDHPMNFKTIIEESRDDLVAEFKNRIYYVANVDNLSDQQLYFIFSQEKSELFYMRSRILMFTVIMILSIVVVYAGFSVLYGKRYNRLIIEDTQVIVEKTVDRETKVLRKQARRDSLTQIYNHAVLLELLEEMALSDRMFTILMIDIDYFKRVNDNYGHLVGDDVLVELSQLFLETIRIEDAAGRYGGEEFMIILRDTNLSDGYAIGERIRKKVMQHIFSSEQIKITVSMGVAQYKDENILSLVKRADKLLYRSKAEGRNRITL